MHTEEERGTALNLTSDAVNRGIDAFQAGDPTGVALEIGYIKGISDLAASEGHLPLARLTGRQVESLKERLKDLLGARGPQLQGSRRKPLHPFETMEESESREHLVKYAAHDVFYEETAAEGAAMPVLFYQNSPLDPEFMSTYVYTPESPEMTLSDIYDVMKCRGRWSRLEAEGYQCSKLKVGTPPSPEDIVRATQFLLSKGFKPMPT